MQRHVRSNAAKPQTFGVRRPEPPLFRTRRMKLRSHRARHCVLKSCDSGRGTLSLTHSQQVRGLTLLEVLLSLGLFLGALAALSQLWYGGVRASVQARLSTQAILRCESKLNEVVAGAVALQTTGDTPFDDDSTWSWNLQVEAGPHADAMQVTVTVSHPGQSGLSSSSHQLRRLIRDPQVWTAAQQATTEETTSP